MIPDAGTVTVCSVAVSTILWGVEVQFGTVREGVSWSVNPVTFSGQDTMAFVPTSMILRMGAPAT